MNIDRLIELLTPSLAAEGKRIIKYYGMIRVITLGEPPESYTVEGCARKYHEYLSRSEQQEFGLFFQDEFTQKTDNKKQTLNNAITALDAVRAAFPGLNMSEVTAQLNRMVQLSERDRGIHVPTQEPIITEVMPPVYTGKIGMLVKDLPVLLLSNDMNYTVPKGMSEIFEESVFTRLVAPDQREIVRRALFMMRAQGLVETKGERRGMKYHLPNMEICPEYLARMGVKKVSVPGYGKKRGKNGSMTMSTIIVNMLVNKGKLPAAPIVAHLTNLDYRETSARTMLTTMTRKGTLTRSGNRGSYEYEAA